MKTVVITGTSRGIGEALAELFMGLEDDWTVYTVPYDLTEISEFETIELLNLNTMEEEEPPETIDLLINNAGVFGTDPDFIKDEIDGEEYTSMVETLEVNTLAPIVLTQRLLPNLIAATGVVLNVSSIMGDLERTREENKKGRLAYRISKAGLDMATAVLANELADDGVRVFSVHPGWVQTEMGGKDADITPEEAADNIYSFYESYSNLAVSGQFYDTTEME